MANTKEVKEFTAYTKQLLDLVIHSIYTHKEIFLRELISNASDALDKLRFASLTKPEIVSPEEEFFIEIKLDKKNRTISITDNGIGMTYDEVIQHIGTIAHSGTKTFFESLNIQDKSQNDLQKLDLIGQFGVGFYSSFMVAKNVVLLTKSAFTDEAVRWESTGDGSYTIEKYDKPLRGTTVILHLRDDDKNSEEGENYSVFLEEWKIEELIKKYSDFIRYPIKMEMTVYEDSQEKDEKKPKEKREIKILNSMKPLWMRDRQEIKPEEYEEFYKTTFHDWIKPIEIIHTKAEGIIEYTALLFIPSKAPLDLMSIEYEKGLRLYSKNIFIMESCKELLPDHYRFVKGLVDSPDFSLNISREILQHDRQLRIIAKNLEKKITDTLISMLKEKREEYENWWKEFGTIIKSGIYTDFIKERTYLHDLLIFQSTNDPVKYTTLDEYIGRMKENQKEIYYISGIDRIILENHPQVKNAKEEGYEVLFFLDKIDEFMVMNISSYKGKNLKALNRAENQEEKSDILKTREEELKPLLQQIEKHLGGKINKVVLSNNLKDSASCLVSSQNGLSIQMEKVLSELEGKAFPKAEKILQINPEHPIFNKLEASYKVDQNSPKISLYADLLYNEALLIEGILPDNPANFISTINNLLQK
ncbi:MAG: molecular chaperone HtpG [Exilispira sp.]|jgi:molecular chaperone HtpG|nr:molecular chaperone HtpG [Exilispira sp.]